MKISKIFIDRPIFASVLSIIVFLAGLLAMFDLPISEYPEVTPPSVTVSTRFPGANPKVISETVAAPLEEQINGIENMLYMSSQSTADGSVGVTVTFKLGTDADLAQQLVQNRVSQALPRLPDIVRQLGVTVAKVSPGLTLVVNLTSPNNQYDSLYLRNYATLNIKDRLSRITGVGQVRIFGSGDYAMRIWLNPEKMAEKTIATSDVISAIKEQNIQVAAGVIGSPPYGDNVQVRLPIDVQGRLGSVEEFSDIIVKTDPATGAVTRIKDIARVELDASDYGMRSLLNNKPTVAIPISQTPDSNSLQISQDVRKEMQLLSKNFPEGVEYEIIYDTTVFVKDSINAVIKTLAEAIVLVVIVVVIFLQTWRASIIPLLAVPVSIVGTFAIMHFLGFSINVLSLFGLVLAIGIVVDDAIVVVENVERNIEEGLSPRDATYKAMEEVSEPIIVIALTLCAVFIPIAFISGLTGQFYKQFAMTIAISTVISAFNSLTLSPALAALLLKGHDHPKDWLTRAIDKIFGRFFNLFNRFFKRSSHSYSGGVRGVLRHKSLSCMVYVMLIAGTFFAFHSVPTGFIPAQDKQYLIGVAMLPDGAILDRTEKVVREMADIALKDPAIEGAVQFPGLSINGFSASPSGGLAFFPLKSFDERQSPELSAMATVGRLSQQFAGIQDAFTLILPPPPVRGLGLTGGFKLQVEDTGNAGYEKMDAVMKQVLEKAYQSPVFAPRSVYSNYNINVPQLQVDLDRTKAKQLGVAVSDVFTTMQTFLGSLYVNDFNQFGRTYQVIVQADAPFRSHADDIMRLKVRNNKGEMVPLGSLITVKDIAGPESVTRYNGYLAADLNGGPAEGYSSGQAQDEIVRILDETLPKGFDYEWTELTYQQILSGNTAVYVFPLCVLLVFLVLASQYESVTLPLSILLIVPMCILSALLGIKLTGGDNNIFTQISLFVLVGLACKNAILIVQFARELEYQGYGIVQAAIQACHLRLRPILMTSFAFIMGVIPLMISTGAGSEMRHAMGIAVFSGMLGVTFFGLFFTPVFYVILRKLEVRLWGEK